MSQEKMLEVTNKHWRIDRNKASQIPIVCATYRGVIRGVFIADEWLVSKQFGNGTRSHFVGHLAPEEIKERYFHKDVSQYASQYPIRYVEKNT